MPQSSDTSKTERYGHLRDTIDRNLVGARVEIMMSAAKGTAFVVRLDEVRPGWPLDSLIWVEVKQVRPI